MVPFNARSVLCHSSLRKEADSRPGRRLVLNCFAPEHAHRRVAASAELDHDGEDDLAIRTSRTFLAVLRRVLVVGEGRVLRRLVEHMPVQQVKLFGQAPDVC